MSEEIKNNEEQASPVTENTDKKVEAAPEATAAETKPAEAKPVEAKPAETAQKPAASSSRPERPQGRDQRPRPQGRDQRPYGDRNQGRNPRFKRKVCRFCHEKNLEIDYKNAELLERFITERGKILPRRGTGTCAKHQRAVAVAIKRARIIALLPFVEQ